MMRNRILTRLIVLPMVLIILIIFVPKTNIQAQQVGSNLDGGINANMTDTNLVDTTRLLVFTIQYLKTEIDSLRYYIAKLELESATKQEIHNFAQIDVSSLEKHFERIDTDLGFFLISLKDVQQYLDGYKFIFSIGNPNSMDYLGFILHVTWGREYDTTNLSIMEWLDQLQKKDYSFAQTLKQGSWNEAVFAISSAKPEDIAFLSVSISVDRVSLFELK